MLIISLGGETSGRVEGFAKKSWELKDVGNIEWEDKKAELPQS